MAGLLFFEEPPPCIVSSAVASACRIGWLVAVAALLVACSTEEAPCGTDAAPAVFEVVDLSPPLDASVKNDAIVHAFTIADAPGTFQSFTFDYGADHDAGLPVGGSMHFTISTHVGHVDYVANPFAWSHAPASVVMSVPERYRAADGCVFAFPEPLFRYALTP